MGPLVLVTAICAVQGLVNAVGSSTVNSYSNVSGEVRVKRSVKCKFRSDPRKEYSSEKFVVSTTSVLPSQCPRESPIHWRILLATWGLPSSGMMRALWIISFRITTRSRDCRIWKLLLYGPGIIGVQAVPKKMQLSPRDPPSDLSVPSSSTKVRFSCTRFCDSAEKGKI